MHNLCKIYENIFRKTYLLQFKSQCVAIDFFTLPIAILSDKINLCVGNDLFTSFLSITRRNFLRVFDIYIFENAVNFIKYVKPITVFAVQFEIYLCRNGIKRVYVLNVYTRINVFKSDIHV